AGCGPRVARRHFGVCMGMALVRIGRGHGVLLSRSAPREADARPPVSKCPLPMLEGEAQILL
ncbi:MAG: hypothetical protein ABIO35_08705, partial [Nitrobacter sp.]